MSESMSKDLVENLQVFCANRKRVYEFLSRSYEVEVDSDFIQQVTEEGDFSSDDPMLVDEYAAMRDALVDAGASGEAGLEQLAVVFNRVFFGMGPRTAQKAFPYESVYTSAEGIMMQEAYSETVRSYRGAKLAKNPNFPEPEDHLAVELAFLAVLCDKSLAALDDGNEELLTETLSDQREFLENHLLNWISPFAADMKGSAEEGFYLHLAHFTEEFLKADFEALSEVLG